MIPRVRSQSHNQHRHYRYHRNYYYQHCASLIQFVRPPASLETCEYAATSSYKTRVRSASASPFLAPSQSPSMDLKNDRNNRNKGCLSAMLKKVRSAKSDTIYRYGDESLAPLAPNLVINPSGPNVLDIEATVFGKANSTVSFATNQPQAAPMLTMVTATSSNSNFIVSTMAANVNTNSGISSTSHHNPTATVSNVYTVSGVSVPYLSNGQVNALKSVAFCAPAEKEDLRPANKTPFPPSNSLMVVTAPTLKLNVGGRSAKIPIESIRLRFDHSRLAGFVEKSHRERLTECDTFLVSSEEYYFEKSPAIFEYIVDYYVTGRLHRPPDMCPIRLREELDFWRVSADAFAECCRADEFLGYGSRGPDSNYHGLKTTQLANEQVHLESSFPPALFDRIPFGRIRLVLWTFFENPRSSAAAKVLSIASATFVLLSLSGLIMSSMPEFQEADGVTPIWYIQALEICCMIFFTLEYVTRLAVVPQKCIFVKQPLNVIDLLTILPFFAEACLPLLGIYDVELRNLRGPMVVIRVMRLARVARIFKLARYSIGLRAFGETMRKSAAELSMLGMFLLTGIMLFSTAIYFFERDEPNSKFYSIPSAWWWCVVTMTTVGYGDLVPVTTGGKVVAAMASVCGIIVLAFPISMIIDKFAESTDDWRGNEFMARRLAAMPNDAAAGAAETAAPPSAAGAVDEPGAWSPPARANFKRGKSKRASRRYLF